MTAKEQIKNCDQMLLHYFKGKNTQLKSYHYEVILILKMIVIIFNCIQKCKGPKISKAILNKIGGLNPT